MKTKLDFYHMTPFYELNYFIAFIVKVSSINSIYPLVSDSRTL